MESSTDKAPIEINLTPRQRPFQGKFFTPGVNPAVLDPFAKFEERSFIHSRNIEGVYRKAPAVTVISSAGGRDYDTLVLILAVGPLMTTDQVARTIPMGYKPRTAGNGNHEIFKGFLQYKKSLVQRSYPKQNRPMPRPECAS